MRPASRVAAILLTATAVVAILVTFLILIGSDVQRTLSTFAIRARDPIRPLVLATTAAIILAAWRWRSRQWRTTALTLLALAGVFTVMIIARRGPDAWPFGDGALIELYTVYATRGSQLLGAYSQYRWHHPGPALFYALAPFYLLGGESVHALNAGALVINLGCLLVIVWVIVRNHAPQSLAVALFALLILFIARVPAILTSAWNPHIAIFPFIALLIVAAASAIGDIRLFPLATVLASFVAQAHVGLVPVAFGVLAAAFVAALASAIQRHADLQPLRRWTNVSVFVFLAMWLLPIAEQIAGTPGNMTRIGRQFFLDSRPGQPAWNAWTTLAETLLLPFRSGFQPPQGWQVVRTTNVIPLVAGTLIAVSMILVAIRKGDPGQRLTRALAALCFTAIAIGFWSVLRIRETIADHTVFWIAALGLVGLATIASAIFSRGTWDPASARLTLRRFWNPPEGGSHVPRVTGALVVATAASLGAWQLFVAQRPPDVRDDKAVTVQVISEETIKTMRQAGIVRPQFLSGERWDIAAGVYLQMLKEGMVFTVDSSEVDFYGHPVGAVGDPDAVFTFANAMSHERLALRPGNILVARYRSVFVDGIRVTPPAQP